MLDQRIFRSVKRALWMRLPRTERIDRQNQYIAIQPRTLYARDIAPSDGFSHGSGEALEHRSRPNDRSRSLRDLIVDGFEVGNGGAFLSRQSVDRVGNIIDDHGHQRVASAGGEGPLAELDF